MLLAVTCQIVLLTYHQFTTFVDLYPFNGTRFCSRRECVIEMGVNGILMVLAPVGFIFRIHGLMLFGLIYYFALFAIELVIWWIPYFTVPKGRWRRVYNLLLSVGTSDFASTDTLDHWLAVHHRVHGNTICILPRRSGHITPNLEHMMLHGWTLITGLVTFAAYLTG
jgi:hypothetical protein